MVKGMAYLTAQQVTQIRADPVGADTQIKLKRQFDMLRRVALLQYQVKFPQGPAVLLYLQITQVREAESGQSVLPERFKHKAQTGAREVRCRRLA